MAFKIKASRRELVTRIADLENVRARFYACLKEVEECFVKVNSVIGTSFYGEIRYVDLALEKLKLALAEAVLKEEIL